MSTIKKFSAVLVSMGANVLELNNEKKTQYRIATIAITTKSGVREVSARVWEKNASKMQPGVAYIGEMSVYDNNGVPAVDVIISALTGAPRADISLFDEL